jgi:2-keto-4-pentenoate hydratase/2-oxohepta-3-ene-1,7-dioic acid hydratase in catechol pathway
MRLVTYQHRGKVGVGIRVEGGIAPTAYDDMVALIREGATPEPTGDPFEPDRILAPLRPGKILCCGINYRSHGEELPIAIVPEEPYFFAKLPNAVCGPGDPIVIPTPETKADWEVELAFVIGRRAKNAAAAAALDHVFGYTLLHDVSARDIQFDWSKRTQDSQITLGKNPDTFSPIGPEIVTKDEIPDPGNVRLATYVNGEQKQAGTTADWLFPIPVLIEFLTRVITLEPGDLVSTGTPAGIGCFRDPPEYLQPGDEVTIEADGIGRLTNPVIAGW